jgi:hypothetical protein
MSALDKQEGGDHYKTMKIQPVEFCQRNGLNFCESSAIKYICRHKRKNGAEDIRKAIHFLELLLEVEYSKTEEWKPVKGVTKSIDDAKRMAEPPLEQFTTADGSVGYQVRKEVCK